MSEVKAVTKYLRISPRKVNRLLVLVRGKGVKEASAILKFMPHKGAKLAWETLRSAIANGNRTPMGTTDGKNRTEISELTVRAAS